MEIPNEAECPKGFLHRYDDTQEVKGAFVERCVNCGHKAVYKTERSGRMDNRRYLRAHYRSFVQPKGSGSNAFRKAFGDRVWREAQKSGRYRTRHDWDTAGQNAHRLLREMKKEKTLR